MLGQTAALVVGGLGLGLAIIRLSEGALTSVLYQVEPSDPVSALAASGLLLTAALVACFRPALRAVRMDLVKGLRAE